MKPSLFLSAALLVPAMSAFAQEADVRDLFDRSDWFALRTRVSPADALLVRGGVASAFNDADALDLLAQATRQQPAGDDAYAAHLFIALQLIRQGQTCEALDHLHAAQAMQPDAEDVKAFLPLVEPFGQFPDQAVERRGHSVLGYARASTGLQVPLQVNGHPVRFILDTGMPWSGISESQARALGMRIVDSQGTLGDAAGVSGGVRVAQAEHVRIGKLELSHVAFLVFRDDQLPYAKLKGGERGLLGLPVILAMRNLAWDDSGRFEFDRPALPRAAGRPSNLSFDPPQMHLLASGEFQGQAVDFELDTGSNDSELWPPFAKRFAALVDAAPAHGSKQENGLNGSTTLRFAQLDSAGFAIGGSTLSLRPARVALEVTKDESAVRDGALGIDLLWRMRSVSLDFATMRLDLGAPLDAQAAAGNPGAIPAISASK